MWSRQAMAQFAEPRIDRMAAVQERKHWRPAHSNFFQRSANSKIAACGYQPFLQRLNRFRGSSRLVINLRQIQIQLSVIVLHAQRFPAQTFSVSEPFLRERGQQACVGKIKRVLGSDAKGAPRVLKRFVSMAVAKIFQAFFKVVHSSICRGGSSDPVGHRLLLRLVGHSRGNGWRLHSTTIDGNRTPEQF